jgi:SAM-dependent methyltransferase
MTDHYIGTELEVFSAAQNWKAYFSRALTPLIRDRVLEVGAGIGTNIPYLWTSSVREWTSVEPDGSLASRVAERAANGDLPSGCRVLIGTIDALDAAARFDAILYIDVLEHIADDREELTRAAAHLAAGGNLVVLGPAHQFLFSPFDSAIGHFRRYNRSTLAALSPPGCQFQSCFMLDSMGFFASLANRVLLKSSMPTERQLAIWDKVLVPISRIALDRLTGYKIGKSIVAVWQRH